MDQVERVKHQLFCSTSNPSARMSPHKKKEKSSHHQVVKSHTSAKDTLYPVSPVFHSFNTGKEMCSLF